MTIHRAGRNANRTVATAAVLLVAVLAAPGRVGAAGLLKAATAKTESVTSAKWAATLSVTSMTFSASTNQTSTVTNTGTVVLVGLSYKVIVSKPVTGTPTFNLFVCMVAWSSGTCDGGAGTEVGGAFAVNSTTTVSSTVVPAVSGHVYLQIEPTSVTSTTTVTLGTSITSASQLRAAIKTNQ